MLENENNVSVLRHKNIMYSRLLEMIYSGGASFYRKKQKEANDFFHIYQDKPIHFFLSFLTGN